MKRVNESSPGVRQMAIKKPASRKKAIASKETSDPPILRLPLVGKVKRADIRKAVLAVRDEKAKARASNGQG